MSNQEEVNSIVRVGPVTLNWVFLGEKDEGKRNKKGVITKKPQYRTEVIFDAIDNKECIAKIQNCVRALTTLHYGDKAKARLKSDNYKKPLHNGELSDSKEDDQNIYAGKYYLNARHVGRGFPRVILRNGERLMELDDVKREMYSGVRVYMTLRLHHFENESRGVGVWINNIMKWEDRERLASGGCASRPEEDFADLVDKDAEVGSAFDDDDDFDF